MVILRELEELCLYARQAGAESDDEVRLAETEDGTPTLVIIAPDSVHSLIFEEDNNANRS